jgi:predicted GIY-YIG superfamily endonuclease
MAKKIFDNDNKLVGFEPGVIYELRFTHSGVDIPFYVGETIDPERRLAEHRYGANTADSTSETKYQFIMKTQNEIKKIDKRAITFTTMHKSNTYRIEGKDIAKTVIDRIKAKVK